MFHFDFGTQMYTWACVPTCLKLEHMARDTVPEKPKKPPRRKTLGPLNSAT
jgi:hypothetical protein